jgi:hypothetical protein
MAGLNVHRGRITYAAVAHDLGLPYTSPEQALQAALGCRTMSRPQQS